jgi:hypothetical protein
MIFKYYFKLKQFIEKEKNFIYGSICFIAMVSFVPSDEQVKNKTMAVLFILVDSFWSESL